MRDHSVITSKYYFLSLLMVFVFLGEQFVFDLLDGISKSHPERPVVKNSNNAHVLSLVNVFGQNPINDSLSAPLATDPSEYSEEEERDRERREKEDGIHDASGSDMDLAYERDEFRDERNERDEKERKKLV